MSNEKDTKAPVPEHEAAGTPAVTAVDAHNNVEVRAFDIEEKTRGVEHDDAAELFAGEDAFEYTPEEATKVLRKLDFVLLPMVCRTLGHLQAQVLII